MTSINPANDAGPARPDYGIIRDITNRLDSTHRPGGTIAIKVKGEPAYIGSFGLANAEVQVPLGPRTRLRISSGLFICLAYLLICEDGKASLDDAIGMRLPELRPVAQAVTVRQLMAHTGGLRDPLDISLQLCGARDAPTPADLLSLFEDVDDLNAPSGTTWIFNAGAYLLLRKIIERTIDGPLEHFLQTRILTPAGMQDTMPVRWDKGFIPNCAALHHMTGTGAYRKSYLHSALAGECGFVTTAEDMLRFSALMDDPPVGSPETWGTLRGPMMLPNGEAAACGLGFIRERHREHELFWHGGTIWGGSAQIVRVPDAKLDVVVLLNRDDLSSADIVREVLDACLPDQRPGHHGATWNMPAGNYRAIKSGDIVQISDGRDHVVAINGLDIPFLPEPDGTLRPQAPWGFLRLSIQPAPSQNGAHTLLLNQFGNVEELIELPEASTSGEQWLGRYYSSSTGITIDLSDEDGARVMRSEGPLGSVTCTLQPITNGMWRRKSIDRLIDGIITVDDSGTAIRYSSWRTRQLVFRRIA